MDKLTFNKRIALTKKEVFALLQEENLDKAGNGKSGYYSIKKIMSHANDIMDKYDIDLDIIISDKIISCVWLDCLSEMSRCVPIELKPISEIEKLPAMQNIIQSEGAILTYYRRYALTNMLNLNATDLIENNKPTQPQQPKPVTPPQNNPVPQQPKLVSDGQLKRLFAIMNEKGKTVEEVNDFIMKKWNIDSKKKLTINMYDQLWKRLMESK